MQTWLTAKGFDLNRLGYGYRTALACCLAVLLAWMSGLEHPQWAGMSVWSASQPVRGQLLEKSLFRFAGTVVGTAFGIVLVLVSGIHLSVLVAGLALWVGLCTWAGNLQRGLSSYGTVLAGYTAAMVALLDSGSGVWMLGLDRMATVLTGVVTGTLVGYYFASAESTGDVRSRAREAVIEVLRHLSDARAPRGREDTLLSRLALLESGLDPHAAGSFQSRREVRATRAVLLSTVPLLLWRSENDAPLSELTCRQLAQAATALERGKYVSAATLLEQLDLKLMGAAGARLWSALYAVGSALRHWGQAQAVGSPTAPSLLLHRDWIGAREAGVRAGGAMLLLGVLWLVTGLSTGPYMLLGLSVMISVFSTQENPVYIMRFVFAGQVLGVLAAIVCRWLLWPLASNEFQLILLLFPCLLLGPWLLSHRRTLIMAMDYSMILLLLSAPHYPLSGSFADSLLMGVSVLAAPVLAVLGYRYVYPVTVQRRQKHLLTLMAAEVQDIAGDAASLGQRQEWRGRFYHRALQLVRNAERLGRTHQVLPALLAYQGVAQASYRCQELMRSPYSSASLRRALKLVLLRLVDIEEKPERLLRAFQRLLSRLEPSAPLYQQDLALFERAMKAIPVLQKKILR